MTRWVSFVLGNPVNLTDPSGENPIVGCIALIATLALVDGPLPIGDIAGLAACAAILSTATYSAASAAYHAPELARAMDRFFSSCGIPDVLTRPGLGDRDSTWRNENPFAGPVIWQAPRPNPTPRPQPLPKPFGDSLLPRVTETPNPKSILYHYSTQSGIVGILSTQTIFPSLWDDNRAAFGHGQYFTDISPADASSGSAYQLSRALYTSPWKHKVVTNYVAIDVSNMMIEQVSPVFSNTYGYRYIYLHRSEDPLFVGGRIVTSCTVAFSK